LFHERNAVGGGSPYNYNRPKSSQAAKSRGANIARLARRSGQANDPRTRELIGEAHANELVSQQLIERITEGISSEQMPPIAGSLLRLNMGETMVRRATIALEVVGGDGITWEPDDVSPQPAEQFIARQASCIGGGTTEMQRNLISERLLGMPREPAPDKDKAFREVHQSIGKETRRS
jgi:alkylation response protein AidB-like acyl-CoA dehydrogenase